MQPIKPFKPMLWQSPWWPTHWGEPAASGTQNDVRYAFFSGERRLLIEENGRVRTYDSGEHEINGISQSLNVHQELAFTSQQGVVDLSQLREVA